MKNIIEIYKQDLRAIVKHKSVLVTIAILCLLPSLYTLVNVRTIWSPTSSDDQIDDIPVAIVNRDLGTAFQKRQINLGNQIMAGLKNNHQIKWQFVSKRAAEDGVKHGRYYAEIEIPSQFSKRLASMITAHPQQAQLIYKANTKDNPMGTEVASVAATSLVSTVREKMIAEVNRVVLSYLNMVGKTASQHRTQLLNLRDLIIMLSDGMGLATNSLGMVNDTANTLATVLTTFKPVMAASQRMTDFSQTTVANNQTLRLAKSALTRTVKQINQSIQLSLASSRTMKAAILQLIKHTNHQPYREQINQINQLQTRLSLSQGQLAPVIQLLRSSNQLLESARMTKLVTTLTRAQAQANQQKKGLQQLKRGLSQGVEIKAQVVRNLANRSQKTASTLAMGLRDYVNWMQHDLVTNQSHLAVTAHRMQQIFTNASGIQDDNAKTLTAVIQENQLIANASGKASDQLAAYRDEIQTVGNQLKLTSNSSMANMITVLQSNPSLMGNSLAQIFTVKTDDIYKVRGFGAAFTPTYMAATIWIGCLILVTVMHTAVTKRKIVALSQTQAYIGRLLTFSLLSLIQMFIVLGSSVMVLHVHVTGYFALILIGILTAITFITVADTLAVLFGYLGKIGLTMLIFLQLAGSGTMYPLERHSLFVKIMQPLFPMKYAVSGFQEAISGPNVNTVLIDGVALVGITVGTLITGLWLQKRVKRPMAKLIKRFKKTGIGQED